MKKIVVLTYLLFTGVSLASHEDSNAIKLCEGTMAYSTMPDANTLCFLALLYNEKWTYELARDHDLLELTLNSGQYELTKILLNKFPRLIVQKGILLKNGYVIDRLGENFYLNAIRIYYRIIVKEYLDEKAKFLKKWPTPEKIPGKAQHPFYEYYWQMQAKKEILYRISLQLKLTMEELIIEFSPKSTLDPKAKSFDPDQKVKKYSKEDLINSLTAIVESLDLNPKKVCHEAFESKSDY